jgi:hypothetical protein
MLRRCAARPKRHGVQQKAPIWSGVSQVQHLGVRTTRTHVLQSRPSQAVQRPSVHSSLGMVVLVVVDVVPVLEDMFRARIARDVVRSSGADE